MKLFQRFAFTLRGLASNPTAKIKNDGLTRLEYLTREYMPSGSGFDSGTKLDLDRSTPDRLVFVTSFHHMNEHGFYTGWTDHTVIVTPSLAWGMEIRVTGRDRNEIKEYIHETFQFCLERETS